MYTRIYVYEYSSSSVAINTCFISRRGVRGTVMGGLLIKPRHQISIYTQQNGPYAS